MVEHNRQKEMSVALTNDIICAISTPQGTGGIAVIRISGPEAIDIADKIWQGRKLGLAESHTAHLGTIVNPSDGSPLDQALATIFKAPHSFTGENVVELSVHGSVYVQQELLRILTANGCRIAQPGEFTRRAFAAGQLDLAEAEAVADLIASTSATAHRLAISQLRGDLSRCLENLRSSLIDLGALLELELDFSEEDVEFASRQTLAAKTTDTIEILSRLKDSYANGSALKRGLATVIVGAPNAGKSTLLNTLLGDERAIVSDIPGTTRDTVEDTLNIAGTTFRLIDTAGLRETDDKIEAIGIDRAMGKASTAAILILLIDSTDPVIPELPDLTQIPHVIAVITKTDHGDSDAKTAAQLLAKELPCLKSRPIEISALTNSGMTALTDQLGDIAKQMAPAQGEVMLTDARHYAAISDALTSLTRFHTGLSDGIPGDFLAQDLREALTHLGIVTGAISSPDLLSAIFERFCIGK